MAQRAPRRESAPAEILNDLSLGYNGYTDPTMTNPKQWAVATNVFSGAFGYIQRCRFANVVNFTPATSQPFLTLKYFALPGIGSYLLGDLNGKLWSFDTGNNYAKTQRINPYVDPAGTGAASLNGPWSRESLQNIVYEMNGTVKQSGRLANAATVEGFGLDAPDSSPAVAINAGATQNITAIARSSGVVSVTLAAALTVPGGNGIGFINVTGVTDTSFNGTFVIASGSGTTGITYNQTGQDVSSSGGAVNTSITKSVGRSYAWAWENANKPHVSAPSPSTQFILYSNQRGVIDLIQPGLISKTGGSTTVTGVGTSFTSAWVGRNLWASSSGAVAQILSVQSATQLTVDPSGSGISLVSTQFQVYDPQATHVRLYETADGGANYFRTQRNAFNPAGGLVSSGLAFFDNGNSEPPSFPFTTEQSQLNNIPPPIGKYLNEYQGRLEVFGVTGALQSFFYSNQETTSIGMPQESYAPLNQVTLPIQNAQLSGMIEFPGSQIIWSDKQDMFRLTGLLSDNSVSTPTQQGATISRLPYALGCANPFACDITPLGGIWVTPNLEIFLYTDRYAPRNIGKPVQDVLSTVSSTQLSLIRTKYFHAKLRNWLAIAIPANGLPFNNTVLVCDLDLLASNGSPSYFTFDMATNHPSWWIVSVRSDAIETVYETGGIVRLMTGAIDLIQDIDFRGGFGAEQPVSNGTVTLHAWGNDSAYLNKKPGFIRFNTNQAPSLLQSQGWSFQVQGADDDFYTLQSPLRLNLTPGVNDTATLGGNPNRLGGSPFRTSPELFKIGGVNFVKGRRIRFQVNFPSGTGTDYQLRSIQIQVGAETPR